MQDVPSMQDAKCPRSLKKVRVFDKTPCTNLGKNIRNLHFFQSIFHDVKDKH